MTEAMRDALELIRSLKEQYPDETDDAAPSLREGAAARSAPGRNDGNRGYRDFAAERKLCRVSTPKYEIRRS